MSMDRLEIDEQLHQLTLEYRQNLQQRLDELDRLWQGVSACPLYHSDYRQCFRLLHSLNGSAATFGYHHLSEIAKQLELSLKPLLGKDRSITDQEAEILTHGLAALRHVAAQGPDGDTGDREIPRCTRRAASAQQQLSLGIMNRKPPRAIELANQLRHFGYETQVLIDLSDLCRPGAVSPSQLLVVDLDDGDDELLSQVAMISGAGGLVICLSSNNSWDMRLGVARADARGFQVKPVDISLLVDSIDNLSGVNREEAYRLIIVEDIPELAQHYAVILRQAGFLVWVLNAPEKVLELVDDVKPDLLLIDIYMPGCTGLEVARVLRMHQQLFSIPIVFLSSEGDPEVQLATLEQGDDFLQKPIGADHLIRVVSSRAARARALNALMYRDSLTGLLNHVTIKLRLESQLAHSQRHGEPLSFVMMDIDRFKQVNDRFGHPMGDQVIRSLAGLLRQRLRADDHIGRYGGEEFALVLSNCSLAGCQGIVEEIRRAFEVVVHSVNQQQFSCTFSAGVVEATAGDTVAEVLQAADAALYRAKEAGRNRLCIGTGHRVQPREAQ